MGARPGVDGKTHRFLIEIYLKSNGFDLKVLVQVVSMLTTGTKTFESKSVLFKEISFKNRYVFLFQSGQATQHRDFLKGL